MQIHALQHKQQIKTVAIIKAIKKLFFDIILWRTITCIIQETYNSLKQDYF